MSETKWMANGMSMAFSLDKLEAFPRLPELAERLGIEEGVGDGNVWATMSDGRRYDVFRLVNAVLDRLDAVEGKARGDS